MAKIIDDRYIKYMIDKETWKTGTDRDNMEKLIKYHMHKQFQKKRLFEIEKTFSGNHKATHCLFFEW